MFKISPIRLGLIAVLLVVLVSLVTQGTAFNTLSEINPGFEGAKCYFYGADILPDATRSVNVPGTGVLHRYQDAENYLILDDHQTYTNVKETYYWTTRGTPNDAGIGRTKSVGTFTQTWPNMGIHVESNIQLQDITRQGDPLGWNSSDPMSARRVEYWSKTLVNTDQTPDKTVYTYKLTKESFLLIPAEFWVGYYLVPSQTQANTMSGWQEGEWRDVQTWFRLDFTTWDNAYKDPWMDDPNLNAFDSANNGTISNQQRTADYRGGFPIAGWIQGWQKAGYEKSAWETGAMNNPSSTSDQWWQTRGTDTKLYSAEELTDLQAALMSKVQFAPGLIGQTLSLYDAPDSKFTYNPGSNVNNIGSLTDRVKTPDSSMKKVMYFPINVLNFGTYTTGNFWDGFKVYYPSCYFRIRMIYGVYGTFTYLWTESVTKDISEGGLNFPVVQEQHGTTIIDTPGILGAIGGLSWWILLAVGVVVLVIILIAVGPLFGIVLLKVLDGKG